MIFEALLSRADDLTLQRLLGDRTIRLLTNLADTRTYNQHLRKVLIDLYGPEGLLLNRKTREILIDLLRPKEVETLIALLEISSSRVGDPYALLKRARLPRGSDNERRFFNFFGLDPPLKEETTRELTHKIVSTRYGLFKHQRDAAAKIKRMLNNEPFRVLLHMPTGSGKTRTAMHVISGHLLENEPTVVVWLAASEELCEQAFEEFISAWKCLGNRDVSAIRFWGGSSFDIDLLQDGFVVASLSKCYSLIRRGEIDFISKLGIRCSLVVLDEAHQAIAPTYRTVINTLYALGQENRLLGLTATPGRTWNDIDADEELAAFFGKRKVRLEVEGYRSPVDYLVDQGYLARAKFRKLLHGTECVSTIDLHELEEDIDVPMSVLKRLGEDEQRNLKVIREVEKLARIHSRIIVFAPSVDCANLVALVLRARGLKAFSVTGETPSIKRRQYIEEYKAETDDVRVMCNYGVLTTGFDAPKTSAAVIARPTKSLVLYSQMVGRAIRGKKAGGNDSAEIVTIVDVNLPGFRTIAEAFDNWEDVWNG